MGCWTRTLSAPAAAVGALVLLVPAAWAGPGGAAYPVAHGSAGGAAYGAAMRPATPPQPVARSFAVSPARVRSPQLPAIRFRVDQPSARTVSARLVFWPVKGGAVARVDLGQVAAGRTVTVSWPEGFAVRPGRYLVRLHVKGRGNRVLARRAAAGVPAKADLAVLPAPPAPRPAVPVPAATPAISPTATTAGLFPVRGPYAWGEGFGAARKGYTHQGQDVLAAEGTPVVAPVAGSVSFVDYQAKGAGWYVVQHADDGRDFFYAHCRSRSVAVVPGQRVNPGTPLCQVGRTGDATGPHLHFEIWIGGWRTSRASQPVDPLAQLQAWAR